MGINSNRIAKFEKVSFDQFKKDWLDTFCEPWDDELRREEYIEKTYNELELPKRSTVGSGGYDFHSPLSFVLEPGEEIKIPLGVKAWMEDDYVLLIFPRSSIGFKYFTVLNNTVGVIDASYYNNVSNEGHTQLKLHNSGDKTLTVNRGDKICQGIFIPYGITVDDDVTEERVGGIGSTGA